MTASTFARANGDAPPTSGPSDLPADAADDDDLPLRIDTLPADLAPLVLERLTFSNLLALRLVCSRLNLMAYAVTKVTLNRRGHLYIPLLRKFSAVQSLTLEGFEQSWIPRLACVLGVFPRLVRLCLRKSRAAGGGGPVPQQMLTDGVMLGVVGALEAGACPLLNNLNLDERLPEATALQLAGAMPPNGGLLFATIQAHEAVVRAMLSRGAHLEAELDEGETALLVAAYHACPAITKLLLTQRAEVNTRRHDGATPLIMAANRGNSETALVLLGAKADVNATMNDGVSPLQRAADKGHATVVTQLLRAGARVGHRTSNGISALWMAAKAGRAEVVALLLDAKAEVDALLSDGGSPLLAASYKGHAAVVQQLLSHRAKVDSHRSDGLTALCQASKAGHMRVAQLLIEAGADVNAAGATYGTTSLLMAAKRGHGAIVELLLSRGADAEVTGLAYGTTALIAAAQQGHLSIVRALLRHGADPAKPLHDGTTALDKARQYAHAEVAAMLHLACERRLLREAGEALAEAAQRSFDAMGRSMALLEFPILSGEQGGDELVSEPTP